MKSGFLDHNISPRCGRLLSGIAITFFLSKLALQAATLPAGFTETQYGADLGGTPTAMEFAPDGRLFVCLQSGQLRVISNGSLLAAPFVSVDTAADGERGLLGVAFDPDFATNHYVYVYYTVSTPPIHNRVSRFTANGDIAVAGSETVILDLDNLSGATNHNGGPIHFGLDGKLYVGVGENANGANAQSLSNRLGKMLRINADGTLPSDNPTTFPGIAGSTSGLNRAIWAVGLRNPFTFAFQPGTGRMFINDVGQSTWEEINDGLAGSNYGWSVCEGFCSPANANYRDPLFRYGHGGGNTIGCAIVGGAFYNPSINQFPAGYSGKYFFADLCSGWIRVMDPISNTAAGFATDIANPVDLKVGLDGSLYYLAQGNDGQVFRIQSTGPTPTPGPTQTPRIDVFPTVINFAGTSGGAFPAPQSIQITASNGASWNSFDTSPWFDAAATSGPSGTSTALTPHTDGLIAGTYTQNITFSATGLPDTVVVVTLVLTPTGTGTPTPTPAPTPATTPTPIPISQITAVPTAITFTGVAGGAFPAPQSIQITASNGASWNSFDSSPWFDAAPTSGPSGTSTTLTPHTNGLIAGTYTQNITFSATGLSDTIMVVTLVLTPTPTPTSTPSHTPTATPTLSPSPVHALNISTRLRVGTGNNTLVGGFIITGSAPKKVAMRGIGPSLAQLGISDVLADPTIELDDSNGVLVAQSDDWQSDPAQAAQLIALGLGLQDPKESGIVATLQPGAYTAVLAGKNNGAGVGLMEIYDTNQAADSQLANISARGLVLTGSNVMIGGFVLGGDHNTHVVVRGIGPSLTHAGLSPVLADPTLELRDSNGALVAANDNWQDEPVSTPAIIALGLAPQDPAESAIYCWLPPGAFTVVLAGKNAGTGIALVEMYNVH